MDAISFEIYHTVVKLKVMFLSPKDSCASHHNSPVVWYTNLMTVLFWKDCFLKGLYYNKIVQSFFNVFWYGE